MQKLTLSRTVGAGDPETACEFLAAVTLLSKNRIKDAMAKGAVWLKKSKRGQHRIRRVRTAFKPGDQISIYYDRTVLAITPQRPQLISDQKRFSVWFKPAGLEFQCPFKNKKQTFKTVAEFKRQSSATANIRGGTAHGFTHGCY